MAKRKSKGITEHYVAGRTILVAKIRRRFYWRGAKWISYYGWRGGFSSFNRTMEDAADYFTLL